MWKRQSGVGRGSMYVRTAVFRVALKRGTYEGLRHRTPIPDAHRGPFKTGRKFRNKNNYAGAENRKGVEESY
jgi:hypothetical protein